MIPATDEQYEFEERVSILMYDAGMSESEARGKAAEMMKPQRSLLEGK